MVNETYFNITDGSRTYCGGSQNWWGKERFFLGVQKKASAGCAAIAAANLAKYLARSESALGALCRRPV